MAERLRFAWGEVKQIAAALGLADDDPEPDAAASAMTTTDPPARLVGVHGHVLLTPDGSRLADQVLRQVVGRAYRDGATPGAALRALITVIREAVRRADGCGAATTGQPFPVTLPGSLSVVTVSEAARIRGCSPQAIRKQIAAGRLPARKHGSQWLLSEDDARHLAPGRSRHGEPSRQRAVDPGLREGRQADCGRRP